MAKLDLTELRSALRVLHEEGERIQSHYKRLEKEYSDWEDRFIALDKAMNEAEDEYKLTKEEIEQPLILPDIDGI